MNYKRLILIVISVVICLILFFLFILNKNTIYSGVTVEGISVAGLNREEAINILHEKLDGKLENSKLNFRYEEYTHSVSFSEIGVTYDYYKAIDTAYSIGRTGGLKNRIKDIYRARIDGHDIKMDLKYDIQKVDLLVNKISGDINRESENAKIKYENGSLIIIPEVKGVKVDKQLFKKTILEALYKPDNVEIPVNTDVPSITEKLLSEIKEPLGTFSTSFYGSSAGRVNNIKLSTKAIDGSVVLPGETFSFNDTTGLRDEDAGYREAKVIVNGKYVDEIGGGVCQVSTTLYNAALLSDLEIVERRPHSIPSAYVDKGRDATVVYGYIDLKFKNNSQTPIYIHAYTKNSRLIMTIFGNRQDKNRDIKILPEIIEKIEPETEKIVDESLNPGEKVVVEDGRYGYRVKTYKAVYENGTLVKKELISSDFYKPYKSVIRIGPEKNSPEENNSDEISDIDT